MIPKILHYVWVGGPLPAREASYLESWKRSNPDYEMVCWNEDNIDFSVPIIRRAYAQRQWARVSDVVRLLVVFRHGGIYLDTDFRVECSLDPLLHHRCFFAFLKTWHRTDWVANGVFGAEPGHWFIREAMDRVLNLRAVPFGLDRPTRSGPKLITALLRSHGLRTYDPSGVKVRDIFVTPAPVFFPFDWTETFTESCIRPETLAVHFWHQSWKKDLPRAVRLIKLVRRRLGEALG